MCSVGVVIVREGEFVDSFYSLIQPEPNYYLYWNTMVHGITKEDTEDAPVFPYVWKQLPKVFARSTAGAVELIVGVIQLVAAHHGFKATFVERDCCGLLMANP